MATKRVLGGRDAVAAQDVQVTRLVARVRWAGVALGVVQALLAADPRPAFGTAGILVPALAMAAYNLPATLVGRLPRRAALPLAMAALAGDFVVVTAWTYATANDVYSTSYATFGLVAIEAAVVFRWRGALAFASAFAVAYAGYYWLRAAAYGYPPEAGSVLFRSGIVVLSAIFVGLLTQASERRRERYEMLLQAMSEMGEGLVITQAGRLVYCNAAYEEITGYTHQELAALPTLIALSPDESQPVLHRRLSDRLAGRQVVSQYDGRVRRRDGRVVNVETVIRPLRAEGQDRLIAVVRDVTERARAQETLRRSEQRAQIAARQDALTGIANRRAWEEELSRAMGRSRRDRSPLTIALLDLDNFKTYNDDWGHVKGDELLCAYAASWRDPLREVDLIARYGGDEFAVLLPRSGQAQARAVIERLMEAAVALPSFSAGVATWDGEESPESLVSRADAALYRSKREGAGRVTVSDEARERSPSWSYLIPRMLAHHELDSVYQAIHRLDSGHVMGYEALARPAGFQPGSSVEGLFAAAKRLGFSRDLDWLCRRSAVHAAHPLPANVLLFINVSVHALLDPQHDVDQMLLLMRWAGRDPHGVVFEISERDQLTNLDRLREVVAEYRAEGFRFALDDVGEGHSTLEVLAAANPEYIKVARTLAVGVGAPGPRSAVQALVTFARSSGAELIAEGLETPAQIRRVRDLGVRYGQGFGLAKPMDARSLMDRRVAGGQESEAARTVA